MKRNLVTNPHEGDEVVSAQGEVRHVCAIHMVRTGVMVVYKSNQSTRRKLESIPLAGWSQWIVESDAKLVIQRRA